MRIKQTILVCSCLCVSVNAVDRIVQSPYLQFDPKTIPVRYAKNPTQYAADMIAKGAMTYQKITQGEIDTNTLKKNLTEYVQSIAALVFYFFSKAVEKGQGFSSGTIVIKDPGFRLYNFLYSYVVAQWKPRSMTQEILIDVSGVGAYPRKSTHFNAFYMYTDKATKGLLGKINKKNEFIHYGIDMPKDLILPAKRKHLLFGKVEINPPLIFIKMEIHGLGKKGVAQHTIGLGKAQMRKFVGQTILKLKKLGFKQERYLGKLLDYFSDVSSDDTAHTRRERIPLAILTEFLALMLAEGSPLQKSDIDKKRIKGLGIKGMLTMLDSYSASQQGSSAWRSAVRDFANKIRAEYDHTDIRLGREVILTPEAELKLERQSNKNDVRIKSK